MGDLSESFRDMDEERKERHARWHTRNRKVIVESGIPFADKGETLLFREPGRPRVDFYPSTGRWRVPGKNQATAYSGGARRFLLWYAKAR